MEEDTNYRSESDLTSGSEDESTEPKSKRKRITEWPAPRKSSCKDKIRKDKRPRDCSFSPRSPPSPKVPTIAVLRIYLGALAAVSDSHAPDARLDVHLACISTCISTCKG